MDPRDQKRLERSTAVLAKKRAAADQAWQDHQALIKEIYATRSETGVTLEGIGQVAGITKARVFQITTGKRSTVKPKEDALAAAS